MANSIERTVRAPARERRSGHAGGPSTGCITRRLHIGAAVTLLASAALAACGSGDPARPGLMGTLTGGDRSSVIITSDRHNWPHDFYQFERMSLDGDVLELDITFGGGCAEHAFALLVDPAMMESHPVQMRGSLAHDAHGDPCRALLSRTLVIDLGPVKDLWRRSYQRQSGTVILNIDGWPTAIVYRFSD
jgi:hypothetical protein